MTVVFLPGINNTLSTFDATRAAMPDNIDTLAVDLPALDDVGAIADAVLAELPDRFVLAGHSFGGYVALAILAAVPERVAGLVLINSNDWADSAAAAEIRETRAQEAENGAYVQLAEAATAKSFHRENLGRADLLKARAAEVEAYGADRFAAHQRASATRLDRGPFLAQSFSGPILIVTADTDEVIPTAAQTQMAERLEATQVIVEHTGHMLPAEDPKALAQALTNWHHAHFSSSQVQSA